LMPVKDEADPDYRQHEEEQKEQKKATSISDNIDKPLAELADHTNTISMQQANELIKLFKQKVNGNKERQTNFLAELDQQLAKRKIEGTTDAGNFRSRLTTLIPADYQYLYN
jgi:hypothetical protein